MSHVWHQRNPQLAMSPFKHTVPLLTLPGRSIWIRARVRWGPGLLVLLHVRRRGLLWGVTLLLLLLMGAPTAPLLQHGVGAIWLRNHHGVATHLRGGCPLGHLLHLVVLVGHCRGGQRALEGGGQLAESICVQGRHALAVTCGVRGRAVGGEGHALTMTGTWRGAA